MKNKNLFSFKDILGGSVQHYQRFYLYTEALKTTIVNSFFTECYEATALNVYPNIPTNSDLLTALKADKVACLLFGYVIMKYWNAVIFVYDKDTITTNREDSEALLSLYDNWIAFYETTKDYYKTMLEAYKNEATAIAGLEGAKVISINKFNDVPQDINTGLLGDSYLTTASRSESEQQEAIMQRLDDLRKKFYDVMDAWANSFKNTFVLFEY